MALFRSRHSQDVSEKDLVKYTESHSFSLIYRMFLMHGCGFTIKFNSVRKALMSVLSLTCDFWILVGGVTPFLDGTLSSDDVALKQTASVFSVTMCALMFRLWMNKNGNRLLATIHIIERLNLVTAKTTGKSYRRRTMAILGMHCLKGLLLLAACVYFTSEIEMIYLNQSLYSQEVHSQWLGRASVTLFYIFPVWFVTAVPPIFFIFVNFACNLIIDSLENFAKKIPEESAINYKIVLVTYNSLTDTILKVNDVIQTPLLLSCAHTLFSSFYGIYISVLSAERDTNKTFQSILVLIWSLTTFGLMCNSSSSVAKSYSKMQTVLHKSLQKKKELKNLSITLGMCDEDFVGFTLLGTLLIDSSLVMEAFATMLMYGILISTFGHTIQKDIYPHNFNQTEVKN